MKRKKLLTVIGSICLILVLVALLMPACAPKEVAPAPAPPEKLVFKYGHCAPPIQIMGRAATFFKEYVEEHSGGAIEIEVYPLSQLGGERAMYDQILAGTLDMGSIGAPIQSTAVPEMNAFCLPFVVANEDIFWDVVKTKEFHDRFTSIVRERTGVELLAYADVCGRGVLNKYRPIRSPEDLQGLKVRVMEGAIYTDMFRAMGAGTAPIPFPELYTALQQGVVDGEDNSCDMAVMMKFVEVEKFYTNTNQTMQTNPLIVAKSSWAKLTAEQKQLFIETAEAMDVFSREEYRKDKLEGYVTAREEYGVEVIEELTAEERAAFKKAVEPVLAKYRKVIGEDFFDFFIDLVNKCEQKYKK